MNRIHAGNLLLVLVIWGMAGALFGSLFAGLYQLLMLLGLQGWQSVIVTSGIAAMATAAFYGAMPVALVGAVAGVFVSIAYLIATGHQIKLVVITGLAASAGLVAGLFYSWLVRGRARPFAQTLSGLIAGLAGGGVIATAIASLGLEAGMFPLAALVVALVGGLFQLIRARVTSLCAGWVPLSVSVPLVSALIAGIVGASVWILGGTTAGALDRDTLGAIDVILDRVPAGLFGGLVGGALIGVALELLGMNPRYDE